MSVGCCFGQSRSASVLTSYGYEYGKLKTAHTTMAKTIERIRLPNQEQIFLQNQSRDVRRYCFCTFRDRANTQMGNMLMAKIVHLRRNYLTRPTGIGTCATTYLGL
jgi:hypothetical protein